MFPVTTFFTAIAALWLVVLSVLVIRQRYRDKVPLGQNQDAIMLQRYVRTHGNFVEFTPFILIILGLLELKGQSDSFLWLLGAAYFTGRLSHAISLLFAELSDWGWKFGMPYFRTLGMVLTFSVLLVGAGTLLLR